MGRRREQRREERATFGRGGTANRYRMRQKLVAFGDDFWIETEAGKLYKEANGELSADPASAKEKLKQIRGMVDASSPWAAKAQALLNKL